MNIKPCVKCGYCCTKSACQFGIWDYVNKKCKYLTKDNLCGIFDKISNTPGNEFMPAFGAGKNKLDKSTMDPKKAEKLFAKYVEFADTSRKKNMFVQAGFF